MWMVRLIKCSFLFVKKILTIEIPTIVIDLYVYIYNTIVGKVTNNTPPPQKKKWNVNIGQYRS